MPGKNVKKVILIQILERAYECIKIDVNKETSVQLHETLSLQWRHSSWGKTRAAWIQMCFHTFFQVFPLFLFHVCRHINSFQTLHTFRGTFLNVYSRFHDLISPSFLLRISALSKITKVRKQSAGLLLSKIWSNFSPLIFFWQCRLHLPKINGINWC